MFNRRAELHTLGAQISASDWPGARATAAGLATHAHNANRLTSGPVWALAASLPSGGEPLTTIRGVTAGVDSLGHSVLPQLVSASQRLNPRTLRHPDGTIDLPRIAAVAPALASASANLGQTTKTFSGLPRRIWLSPIDADRLRGRPPPGHCP